MTNKKQVDLGKVENSGTAIFKKHLLSLNKKSNVFEIKNWKVLAKQNHTFLSDWSFDVQVLTCGFESATQMLLDWLMGWLKTQITDQYRSLQVNYVF